MSDKDGTPTGGDNPGAPTQGDVDASKAAAGDLKFSDDHMAAAKSAWEKKSKRDTDRAIAARERSILDEFEVDTWDEIKETLTAKRQEQTELEQQYAELKKAHRQTKKRAEAHDELLERYTALQQRVSDAAKKDAVFEAAKKADAHEDLVFLKASGRLGVNEDGEVFVRDDDGDPAGISVEKYIQDLVAEDPRLQRATEGAGGGSLPPAGAGVQGGQQLPPSRWMDKIRGTTADVIKSQTFAGTSLLGGSRRPQ